jgi:hypothetical protein
MNKNHLWLGAALLLIAGLIACRSKTPVEKVKDKLGDALHETGQAIERVGNRIKGAAH